MFLKFWGSGKFKFINLLNDKALIKGAIAENDKQAYNYVGRILTLLDTHAPQEEFPWTSGRLVFEAFKTLATCGFFKMADKLLEHISPRNYDANGQGWERDKEAAYMSLAVIYIWRGDYETSLKVVKNVKDPKSQERIHELIDKYKKLPETREKVEAMRKSDEEIKKISKLTPEDVQLLESNAPIDQIVSHFQSQKTDSKATAEISDFEYKKSRRIIEVVNRYTENGQYKEAELLLPLISISHENWYALRRMALKIASTDIKVALDFTKKIKENTLKMQTKGMIGLLAYDAGQKQKAYEIIEDISNSYRNVKEAYTNFLIEKMISNGDWPKALEFIDGFNHDERKYDALMKYSFYSLIKKEAVDTEMLISKLTSPSVKIIFIGFLIFMKSVVAKDYHMGLFQHFRPNSWRTDYGDETEKKLKEIFSIRD